MTNNYLGTNQQKGQSKWLIMLMLYLSFIWISIYPSTNILTGGFYFGYGNLFDSSSGNLTSFVFMVLTEALASWITFEIVFYIYRWFLGFKIYSFIVPADKLKQESRVFFIYRNVFYGILVNLCFLYPFLCAFLPFFDLVITLIALIAYSYHLNKNYAEPIVGHFVFKCFCYPIFVYEALTVFSQIMEVL